MNEKFMVIRTHSDALAYVTSVLEAGGEVPPTIIAFRNEWDDPYVFILPITRKTEISDVADSVHELLIDGGFNRYIALMEFWTSATEAFNGEGASPVADPNRKEVICVSSVDESGVFSSSAQIVRLGVRARLEGFDQVKIDSWFTRLLLDRDLCSTESTISAPNGQRKSSVVH